MRLLFTVLLLCFSKAQASSSKVQVKILQSTGTISDLSLTSKTVTWNKSSRVAERLSLSLSTGAQTKIQLHPHIVLTAYGNTEFEIPFISWETRQFKEIKLQKGILRLEISETNPFEFEIITPFYQLVSPPGMWVFSIDPERALADIIALKGDLEVTTLNSEEKVILRTGDRSTFRGVLEEGEIAYDLLLKGRKIPKGKWLGVEKLTAEDRLNYSLESEKKKQELELRKRAKSREEQLKKQANQTCTKPGGELGQCLWKKEKADCIRTRCAADGLWKDPQVVDKTQCDKARGWKPTSRECDY